MPDKNFVFLRGVFILVFFVFLLLILILGFVAAILSSVDEKNQVEISAPVMMFIVAFIYGLIAIGGGLVGSIMEMRLTVKGDLPPEDLK